MLVPAQDDKVQMDGDDDKVQNDGQGHLFLRAQAAVVNETERRGILVQMDYTSPDGYHAHGGHHVEVLSQGQAGNALQTTVSQEDMI